jgi:hypothetical protein
MSDTFLIITSIASQNHPVLNKFAQESTEHNVAFVVVGDKKSPTSFDIEGCDFYSAERQQNLVFNLAKVLPYKHYARKNIGYLIAKSKGAEIIIETDDDNWPMEGFWNERNRKTKAHLVKESGWVNVYKHFTEANIWPRGFALENLHDKLPLLEEEVFLDCPIQQGLADENPDVDAIYRLVMPLPLRFNKASNIALSTNSYCPFNSQNTTWFRDAFPLMYLPSYCSFRMTDIWRSFVAQRIAWTCGWPILFHNSTVWQERNDHSLIIDFRDEITGYMNNAQIFNSLLALKLKNGVENIPDNLITCYRKLIEIGVMASEETILLDAWLKDIYSF